MDDDIFFQPRTVVQDTIMDRGGISRNIIHPPSLTDDSEYSALNLLDSLPVGFERPLQYNEPEYRGFQSTAHHQRKHVGRTVVYDFRTCGRNDYVKGIISVVRDQRNIADLCGFDISSEDVLQHTDDTKGIQIYILEGKKTEKYIQIKVPNDGYICLRIRQQDSPEKISKHLQKISSRYCTIIRNSHSHNLLHKQSQAIKQNNDFALFFNEKRVAVSDVLKLSNLAIVKLLSVMPVVWHFCYRYKLFFDKRCQLHCSSFDTLMEIKHKFLDLLQRSGESEGIEELSVDSVWFTQGNKQVTEVHLKQTFWFETGEPSDYLKLSTIPHLGVCVDEVFVHFQPSDAVCAEVIMNTDSAQTAVGILVLSPQQTASQVREEVAKLVGRKAQSIRILLGSVKLDNRTNLYQALCAQDCRITVTTKEKISLSVRMWSLCFSGEKTLHLSVYSNDKVAELKSQLCTQTKRPPHLVDLLFEGRVLDEGSTLSDHRLRHNDKLEARVFPRRRTLSVRTVDRKWWQVIVDDCRMVSMGQLKVFCQTLGSDYPVPSCELTAILCDRVVSDTEILSDVIAGLLQMPKLILVRTENLCFTADTSYRGTYIVCTSTEGSHFVQVFTMFNGEEVLYGYIVKEAKMRDMLEKRRCLQPLQPVPGIRLLSQHQHHAALSGSCSASALRQNKQEAASQTAYPRETSGSFQRSSIIGFHTGNSLSDVELAGEELTAQASSEDGDGAACGQEVDSEDTTDDPSNMPVDGHIIEDVPCRERSKSCPPCDRVSRPGDLLLSKDPNKHYNSESVLGGGKREMKRVTTCSERFIENEDGTVTIDQVFSSQARVTPELAWQHLSTSPSVVPRRVSFGDGGGEVVPYQNKQVQTLSTADPAYRNIKPDTIHWIAKHLGTEGMMIMRGLGVTDIIISQASVAHPRNLVEQYQYCLRNWCTKSGFKASKEVLKRALENGERRDLAEQLDEIEPEPKSPLSDIENGASIADI